MRDRRILGGALLAVVCAAACGSETPGAGDPSNGSNAGTSSSSSGGAAPAPPPPTPAEAALVLTFGDDVLPAVHDRVVELLTAASELPVRQQPHGVAIAELAVGSVVLSFGATLVAKDLVDAAQLAAEGPEGFVVRTGMVAGAKAFATVGNAPTAETVKHGNLGTAYGTYALLEELGFAFMHPLAPTRPAKIVIPATLTLDEKPTWRIRGIHLHAMHPLELTELLQGWGNGSPDDAAGWEAMLPEWDTYLEWMLANRQNRVEWNLLWADSWGAFADGPVRQARLATLVQHAHAHGLGAGVDAAIALQQQHQFRLIRNQGDRAVEIQQLHQHLDWVFGAGFDFLSTESGTTEFTHPAPSLMLAWMNEAATYTKEQFGAPSYIKAHCSTGQFAEGYPDPVTGDPINFNFLPHYAVPALGVMPHTVQFYGLHDKAPTYGNTDFRYIQDFLAQEVGRREVLWHPETAYWVNFDTDVPLFLPVYAERRVDDLRLLLREQNAGRFGQGKAMDGQMIFSSGWEWGYWLNDVVAARAAWNPHLEAATSNESMTMILRPLARAFGGGGDAALAWIASTASVQRELLSDGRVGGVAPADIEKRNGIAYLAGFDAMTDLAADAQKLGLEIAPVTQPKKLGLVEVRNPLHAGPDYDDEVEPLLGEMETRFGGLSAPAWVDAVPATARDLSDDLRDAARMTALRAKQVHGLYDYAASWPLGNPDMRLQRLQSARDALDEAATVVAQREAHYRVPVARIAGWRETPVAYSFTYLWPVHSLYFWWRDEGKAVDAPVSPCYLNIIDPADVGLGEGAVHDIAGAIRGNDGLTECLAAPATEPHYPRDDLRSRP